MSVCTTAGCPKIVPAGSGRCQDCRRKAERSRGSAWARGYDAEHQSRFREGVLAKHPICVLCFARPATEADHHPRSRVELIEDGADPNDPRHGRGLCKPCHSRETATSQPAGFHQVHLT